ncbi:MAG: hypothetical protein P1V97_30425 [Planctomycetota bacterium]|nr:hypothetical protein [Planctomycetota bacterium]
MSIKLAGLEKVAQRLNVDEFKIKKFDSVRLTICGSFDFCYYHQIEIHFDEVSYIDLPCIFWAPSFREASKSEIAVFQRSKGHHFEAPEVLLIMDAESPTASEGRLQYYIVCESAHFIEGMVYYYERENLVEGERISIQRRDPSED